MPVFSAPRPTCLPGWSSGGSGFVGATEPIASQKATGWVTGQAPPASYMNFLQSLGYQWLSYFSDMHMRRSFYVSDDFQGPQIDQTKWQIVGSPTILLQGHALSTSGTIGELFFYAESSNASRYDSSIACGGAPVATGNFKYEARVRGLASGFSGGYVQFGVQGIIGGAGVLNAYVRATGGTNGTYKFVYGTGASPTSIDLNFLPSTGYQRFEIERLSGMLTLTIGSPTGGGASQISVPLAQYSEQLGPIARAFSTGMSLGMAMDSMAFIADTTR